MKSDLDPYDVAQRFAQLSALYVPETVAEGRERLRQDALSPDVIILLVGRRLDELRALDDLTRHLHAATLP